MASQSLVEPRTWLAYTTHPLPSLQPHFGLFRHLFGYISEGEADTAQQEPDFAVLSLRSYGLWRRNILTEQRHVARFSLTASTPCQLSNHGSACFSVCSAISARSSLLQPSKNQASFCPRSGMLTFGALKSGEVSYLPPRSSCPRAPRVLRERKGPVYQRTRERVK